MKKVLYIILLIFSIIPALAVGQSVVTGIVKDNSGPLPGITIVEKGRKIWP